MRALAVLAVASVWSAGCAVQAGTPTVLMNQVRPKTVMPQQGRDAVIVGKSTYADVTRALGDTLTIRFDSGYEVWVYRLPDDAASLPRFPGARNDKAWRRTPPEFVVLFDPSGVVARTRIRPAPLP